MRTVGLLREAESTVQDAVARQASQLEIKQ